MMKRLGIDYKETEYIKEVFKLKYLKITGVYSHLCDVKDKDFTAKQLESYDKVVMLKINGYSFKSLPQRKTIIREHFKLLEKFKKNSPLEAGSQNSQMKLF